MNSKALRRAKEREMPLHPPVSLNRRRDFRAPLLLLACCAALSTQAGCINVMTMAGKVLFGDPVVTSSFERQTGVRLAEGHTVGIACTAPASLTGEFDAMHSRVQEEVIRRMRVRGLDVVDSGRLISAMDEAGGRFNELLIAQSVPGVDYLIHVELAQFTVHEPQSPALYRGRAHGTAAGFQVRRDEATGAVDTVPVFQKEFAVEYPSTHPIATDQMSKSTFVNRCVDEISSVVGQMLYDVPASELY